MIFSLLSSLGSGVSNAFKEGPIAEPFKKLGIEIPDENKEKIELIGIGGPDENVDSKEDKPLTKSDLGGVTIDNVIDNSKTNNVMDSSQASIS